MSRRSSVAEATRESVASPAESTLRRAVDRLMAETGLEFPENRLATLRRALATVAAEAETADIDGLLDEIDRQPRLLERLVSLVTIGETYFFRHPEQLDVVSRRILPSLIAEGADARQSVIRVWCAGCSTGEEAYSLAILVNEALDDRPGWEFRVAATDIDREALRRARAASYPPWSFRADLGQRAHWFEVDGARQRVRSSVADRVAFSADNLSLEDAALPPGLGGAPNLILCRNVTMYLSEEARKRVAARFLHALAPGGWLLVAPVELSSSVYAAFETVVLDGLTFYRRPTLHALNRVAEDADATRPRAVVRVGDAVGLDGSASIFRVASPPGRAHENRRPRLPTEHRSKPPVRSPRHDPAVRMATARRLADQGLLAEARRESVLAVHENPHGGREYLLLASIADAQDDLAAAAAALRRAVYLDRTDAATQFQLGLLEWRMGRKRPARARLAAALALVAGRGEAEMLDEGLELTVGRLRSTAELLADG